MSACIALRDDYDSLALRDLARRSRDPRQVRRLLALAAAYDGLSRTAAAKVGGMDRQTLRDWEHRFNDEGPDGLKHRSGAGRPRLVDARTDERTLRDRGNQPRSRGGRRGSLATYRPEAGHRRTLWCDLQRADHLRSAGGAVLLAHQRASAAPQTGRASNRGVQKNFPRALAAHIAALPKTRRVEIWFQDEARLGQKNGRARIWAKTGTRPRLPADQRYANAYLFGAICPMGAKGAALMLPFANTRAMQMHLDEISCNVAAKAHGVVLMDRAGWHSTDKLKVPENLTIILLPSRSPELNPVENIWQYLRQNWLSKPRLRRLRRHH